MTPRPINTEKIPKALKALTQWVVWRLGRRVLVDVDECLAAMRVEQ